MDALWSTLNALMIEPSLYNNKANFEDQYFVSIIGNDHRIRAQFLFLFEHSEHRISISPAVLSPSISTLDRDEPEEEYIRNIYDHDCLTKFGVQSIFECQLISETVKLLVL